MGAMTAEGDLATVRRFMELIATGQLEEARPMMRDDFVVSEAGGLPYSGEYHGPDGFFELVGRIYEVVDLTPESVEVLEIGDTFIGRFRLRFTAKATGKSVAMSFVEIYTVRDGLIASLDVYYKDPSAVTALLAQ